MSSHLTLQDWLTNLRHESQQLLAGSADRLLQLYLTSSQKMIRRHSRRLILRMGDHALPAIQAEIARQDQQTLMRTIKLLGRIASPRSVEVLGQMLFEEGQTSPVQALRRQATIESLSIAGISEATELLRRALQSATELGFDEGTIYILIESLAHSEDPTSPTAFVHAKYIPVTFRIGPDNNPFAGRMKKKLDRIYRKMGRANNTSRALIHQSQNTCRISAATINVGMLNGPIAKVPKYKERSLLLDSTLHQLLSQEKSPSILMIQELWYPKDFAVVQSVALACGFEPIVHRPAYSQEHGLQMLIKKSLLAESPREVGFHLYNDGHGHQARALFEKVANIKRGVLYAHCRLANGCEVLFCNTHLSPLPRFFGLRNQQVVCLGRFLKKTSKSSHFWVLGGDLNVAVDYSGTDGSPVAFWELDRFNYFTFWKKTKSIDTFRVIHREDPGYTINPLMAGKLFSNKGVSQRLDYVWLKAVQPQAMAVVEGSSLILKEQLTAGGEPLFLSDHFGVQSHLLLGLDSSSS